MLRLLPVISMSYAKASLVFGLGIGLGLGLS